MHADGMSLQLSPAFVREASYVYQESKDFHPPDSSPESNYRQPAALLEDGTDGGGAGGGSSHSPPHSPPLLPAKGNDSAVFTDDDFNADMPVPSRGNVPSVSVASHTVAAHEDTHASIYACLRTYGQTDRSRTSE